MVCKCAISRYRVLNGQQTAKLKASGAYDAKPSGSRRFIDGAALLLTQGAARRCAGVSAFASVKRWVEGVAVWKWQLRSTRRLSGSIFVLNEDRLKV
jgi:hypothetical protein